MVIFALPKFQASPKSQSILALLVWIILYFLIDFGFNSKMPFGPYLIISSILIKILDLGVI